MTEDAGLFGISAPTDNFLQLSLLLCFSLFSLLYYIRPPYLYLNSCNSNPCPSLSRPSPFCRSLSNLDYSINLLCLPHFVPLALLFIPVCLSLCFSASISLSLSLCLSSSGSRPLSLAVSRCPSLSL